MANLDPLAISDIKIPKRCSCRDWAGLLDKNNEFIAAPAAAGSHISAAISNPNHPTKWLLKHMCRAQSCRHSGGGSCAQLCREFISPQSPHSELGADIFLARKFICWEAAAYSSPHILYLRVHNPGDLWLESTEMTAWRWPHVKFCNI